MGGAPHGVPRIVLLLVLSHEAVIGHTCAGHVRGTGAVSTFVELHLVILSSGNDIGSVTCAFRGGGCLAANGSADDTCFLVINNNQFILLFGDA